MEAEVNYSGANVFNLTIADLTSGYYVTTTQTSATTVNRSSAEWVVEAPSWARPSSRWPISGPRRSRGVCHAGQQQSAWLDRLLPLHPDQPDANLGTGRHHEWFSQPTNGFEFHGHSKKRSYSRAFDLRAAYRRSDWPGGRHLAEAAL